MRAVVQRAKNAKVQIDGKVVGAIENGLVVFLGVTKADTEADVDAIVNKLIHLRIFEDDANKMNLSLQDIGGSLLSVSQFTLYADIRKGRRPSFINAAAPTEAEHLYEVFNARLTKAGIHVETGQFGAMMDVALVNDGPVTIIIETEAGKIIDPVNNHKS